MRHITWLLGVIVALVGLWKGFTVWRKNRLERQFQRSLNEQRLEAIYNELHPNGGASIADKINRIEDGVTDNKRMISENATENASEHSDLHRRIDGIFELLVGGNATEPRKIQQRHEERRDK